MFAERRSQVRVVFFVGNGLRRYYHAHATQHRLVLAERFANLALDAIA